MGTGKPIIVFLVGRPLAGKTDLAKAMVKNFGFTHLSTSELLRRLAPELKAQMEAGELASDDLMLKLIAEAMPSAARVVIDSPRTSHQVEHLVRNNSEATVYTFYMRVSNSAISQRLRDARNTGRGVRADDAAVWRRVEIFDQYFDDMQPTLVEMTRFEPVDADPTFERVEQKLNKLCEFVLGLRSHSEVDALQIRI